MLPAFSPFSTMFYKGFFLLVVKTRDCMVKSLGIGLLTSSQTTNFRFFKLKEFANNNFKFDEKGRTLSKPVENLVEKQEIACYEQFLHFPQCFQKTCNADT